MLPSHTASLLMDQQWWREALCTGLLEGILGYPAPGLRGRVSHITLCASVPAPVEVIALVINNIYFINKCFISSTNSIFFLLLPTLKGDWMGWGVCGSSSLMLEGHSDIWGEYYCWGVSLGWVFQPGGQLSPGVSCEPKCAPLSSHALSVSPERVCLQWFGERMSFCYKLSFGPDSLFFLHLTTRAWLRAMWRHLAQTRKLLQFIQFYSLGWGLGRQLWLSWRKVMWQGHFCLCGVLGVSGKDSRLGHPGTDFGIVKGDTFSLSVSFVTSDHDLTLLNFRVLVCKVKMIEWKW